MIHKIKDSRGRGFTLVELLAVIVILAIILVIAVPKVMSVIEDAKKATLESTAKMIASQAEKQKVQNTVLGSDKNITCKDITNINDVDYEDCDIVFDNNTAKVTITGSGKFEGLYVCNGTKTSAVAQTEECTSTSVVTGAKYLEGLLAEEETQHNGLQKILIDPETETFISNATAMQGDAGYINAGIRYVGAMSDVKNKVYYNCEDIDSAGVSYGENNYDYASSCEVWRIIGVFDVKSSETGEEEKRIKIINTTSTFQAPWDRSPSDINKGYGINQWGPSKMSDGSEYNGSDIMQLLNSYYIGAENSICSYCSKIGISVCLDGEGIISCSKEDLKNMNMKVLTNTAKNMIENALWYTYASVCYGPNAYLQERGITQKYNGCRNNEESTLNECVDDGVIRNNRWIGRVGLMSAVDLGYADGWLFAPGNGLYYALTMTPTIGDSNFNNSWVWHAESPDVSQNGDPHPIGRRTDTSGVIFPSVYLKSNVQIIDGNGNDKPYILK